MQKPIYFYLFLTILIITVSCENNNEITPSIVGRWELEKSINGMTGSHTTYVSGNGNIMEFSTNRYKYFDSEGLIREGRYKIIREESILTDKLVNRIMYDEEINNPDGYIRFVIETYNNRLILSVDAYDGPSSIYIKL